MIKYRKGKEYSIAGRRFVRIDSDALHYNDCSVCGRRTDGSRDCCDTCSEQCIDCGTLIEAGDVLCTDCRQEQRKVDNE